MGWVWLGILGEQWEAKASNLIFGCWTADVSTFGQIGFPIWIQFLLVHILLLLPPCLMPGWKWGSLQGSHEQLADCELGTSGLELPSS